MMRGISFNYSPPISDSIDVRMDVACFIGYVPMNKKAQISPSLMNWWDQHGWDVSDWGESESESLTDIPFPLESWDDFLAIFDESRLTHRASLTSQPVSSSISFHDQDKIFNCSVDTIPYMVVLETGDDTLSIEEVQSQLQDALPILQIQLTKDSESGHGQLSFLRTDDLQAGELTIFKNESLGFPQTREDDESYITNYTASAIKAFFRQGGAKCYLIPMGNPYPYYADEKEKVFRTLQLIWGKEKAEQFLGKRKYKLTDLQHMAFPEIPVISQAYDKDELHGISHLTRLTDVTWICFPDFVDLFVIANRQLPITLETSNSSGFMECSHSLENNQWRLGNNIAIQGYNQLDYFIWKHIIERIVNFLSVHVRNTQLVTSLPIPTNRAQANFEAFIRQSLFLPSRELNRQNRHLQLVYPWLKVKNSSAVPEELEPPEGTLIGLLAAGAITQGSYMSIAGKQVDDVYDLFPNDIVGFEVHNGINLADKINLFRFFPKGIELSSDVTLASDSIQRYASVRRIMIFIQKAAWKLGLSFAFRQNSERTWKEIERILSQLMLAVYQNNGLRGLTADEAFTVQCDRNTMSRNDIDNGRMIARIMLQPAVPIEKITVDLLMEPEGSVLLRSQQA